MYVRSLAFLLFIFSSCCVQAQAIADSILPLRGISSIDLMDVQLQKNIRIVQADKPLSLFIFLSPECPLCQNYTKKINQLNEKFDRQVNIYGIIPGNAYIIDEVATFANKYHTSFKILIDTKQQLTRYLNATVTPQAILLDSKGNLIYTGAIDDWVQGLGRKKLKVAEHYVQDAIQQSLQSDFVKIKKTNVFGCKINDY